MSTTDNPQAQQNNQEAIPEHPGQGNNLADVIYIADGIEYTDTPQRNKDPAKVMDIFQHLKANMGCQSDICTCTNTIKFYCIPCKATACINCTLEKHRHHCVINLSKYEMTNTKIDELFSGFEDYQNSSDILCHSEIVMNELNKNLDEFYGNLIKTLENFKNLKKDEINKFYNFFLSKKGNTLMNIKKTKEDMLSYLLKNNAFYNMGNNAVNEINKDLFNTTFLINYDMMRDIEDRLEYVQKKTRILKDEVYNYVNAQKDEYQNIQQEIDKILLNNKCFMELKYLIPNESYSSGTPLKSSAKNSATNTAGNGNKERRNLSGTKRNNKKNSNKARDSKKIYGTSSVPKKDMNRNSGDANGNAINVNTRNLNQEDPNLITNYSIKKENDKFNTSDYSSGKKSVKSSGSVRLSEPIQTPLGHAILASSTYGENPFKELNSKIATYNDEINCFKKAVFQSYNRTNNFKEVEKQLKTYENLRQKGAEGLFSERVEDEKSNLNGQDDNYENARAIQFHKNILSQCHNPATINQQNNYKTYADVILNNALINRYFSFLMLEIFDKKFKKVSKELQSSHADLMIRAEDDDEDNDYGKALEGTNEILFYEKKTKKMTKLQVNLTKNPFGYTKFPIGCRSLLLGDKLYISGGRDENNEYKNVLIYDRKRNLLKRIMDMKYPHCYHTMIYSPVFESIIILGGENESSVEIFDPLSNRWQQLPAFNVPRANVVFYCDTPRGVLYSMFGVVGNIIDSQFSDIIEFLDLKNMKDGWNVLDYKNKSGMDFKAYMNIYPLNSESLLLYGGVVFRGINKSLCVMNLLKSEMNKINDRLMDDLRVEAKKSRRLSSIISGFNTKSNNNLSPNTPN